MPSNLGKYSVRKGIGTDVHGQFKMLRMTSLSIFFPGFSFLRENEGMKEKDGSDKSEFLAREGYYLEEDCFSPAEVEAVSMALNAEIDKGGLAEAYGIRSLIRAFPSMLPLIMSEKFRILVNELAGPDCFLTKAIYFDKPPTANWFVPYHQDLSIPVKARIDVPGFRNWTSRLGLIGVHPPVEILESITTFRIHLDPADSDNGALKVIPGSHARGIIRKEVEALDLGSAVTCAIGAGGVVVMKPLTMHASDRARSSAPRRVIHLEFSAMSLPVGLEWAERKVIDEQ